MRRSGARREPNGRRRPRGGPSRHRPPGAAQRPRGPPAFPRPVPLIHGGALLRGTLGRARPSRLAPCQGTAHTARHRGPPAGAKAAAPPHRAQPTATAVPPAPPPEAPVRHLAAGAAGKADWLPAPAPPPGARRHPIGWRRRGAGPGEALLFGRRRRRQGHVVRAGAAGHRRGGETGMGRGRRAGAAERDRDGGAGAGRQRPAGCQRAYGLGGGGGGGAPAGGCVERSGRRARPAPVAACGRSPPALEAALPRRLSVPAAGSAGAGGGPGTGATGGRLCASAWEKREAAAPSEGAAPAEGCAHPPPPPPSQVG